jgi:Asp-tRNA(Asn)/Glu-tRNA(Gln) amidotransferase A subunit family amidase
MTTVVRNTVVISKAKRSDALTHLKDQFTYDTDPDSKSLKSTLKDLSVLAESSEDGSIRLVGAVNDDWNSALDTLEQLGAHVQEGSVLELFDSEGEAVTRLTFNGSEVTREDGDVQFPLDTQKLARETVISWLSWVLESEDRVASDLAKKSLKDLGALLVEEVKAEKVESLELEDLVEQIESSIQEAVQR